MTRDNAICQMRQLNVCIAARENFKNSDVQLISNGSFQNTLLQVLIMFEAFIS